MAVEKYPPANISEKISFFKKYGFKIIIGNRLFSVVLSPNCPFELSPHPIKSFEYV
jgi:hypothetical protein